MANTSNSSQCPIKVIEHFKEVYPVEHWKMEGFFEDEDLLDIACHWPGFDPPRSSLHFLLAIVYVIIFLIGLLSNSLVIYVSITSSSRRLVTSFNILLANLAISDLIIVLTIPIFVFNSLHQGPAIGKLGCTLYGFLTGLSGTASIMSIAAIAFDRYLAITRPLNVRRKTTRRWAFLMIFSVWAYSAIFASLPFFGVGKYVPEGLLTSCSFDYMSDDMGSRIFILVFFIGAWVVPLSIIVYCYSSIVRAVFHVRRDVVLESVANTDSSGNRMATVVIPLNPLNSTGVATPAAVTNINETNAELKVSKVVLSLIATWTVAWTPYAVVALIGIFGYGHHLTPMSAMLPALFAKLATCVDPFIYTLNQTQVRTEIFRHLGLLPPVNPSAGATPYYQYPSRPLWNDNNSHRTPGSSQRQSTAGRRSTSPPMASPSPVSTGSCSWMG